MRRQACARPLTRGIHPGGLPQSGSSSHRLQGSGRCWQSRSPLTLRRGSRSALRSPGATRGKGRAFECSDEAAAQRSGLPRSDRSHRDEGRMKARMVTTSELVSVGPEMPTLAARAISDPVFANVDPDRADGIQCILRCAYRMLLELCFTLPQPHSSRFGAGRGRAIPLPDYMPSS